MCPGRFKNPRKRGISGAMETEQTTQGQPDGLGAQTTVDLTVDVEAHEVAQRGQHVLELSKELTSSSKALLEQIDPIA